MCYLCQKYAPIDGIDEYDPQKDPLITGNGLSLSVLKTSQFQSAVCERFDLPPALGCRWQGACDTVVTLLGTYERFWGGYQSFSFPFFS